MPTVSRERGGREGEGEERGGEEGEREMCWFKTFQADVQK